jgi:GNAT superfamily N-acetyltransferase
MITVRELRPGDAETCDAIILTLPYFFGVESGRQDCARAVRSQPGVVAEVDGEVVGFLTLEPHFDVTWEITWMAVHADHRHRGVGRALMDEAARVAGAAGAQMMSVLTAGPSDPEEHEDNYDGTRSFYRAMGFVPLQELRLEGWGQWALILARRLNDS